MKISNPKGFTLVELMVVISIISILSAILYANFGSARSSGRDAKRQSDVQNLQTAIELYKKENGKYPDQGCGTPGVSFASEGATNCSTYIKGLAPEFISVLPRDPQRGTAPGYSYMTNSQGTTFKVMAQGTVEGEVVTYTSKLRSCDVGTNGLCPSTGVCANSDARFKSSYGAWGGYADGDNDALVKAETRKVICK